MRYTSIIFTIIALALVSTGCEEFGGNPLDPAQMRPDIKPANRPKRSQEEEKLKAEPRNQESAQLEDYQRPTYPNGVRRNPFKPDPQFLVKQAAFENENVRVKEPLENFGIGELKLVAIISGITVPKAMFIDPQGLGHFAKVGDRIGQAGQIISAIREASVSVSTPGSEVEGEEGNAAGAEQIIRMADVFDTDSQTLTEEDREELDRLLNSPEGRKAASQALDSQPNSQQQGSAPGNDAANTNPAGYNYGGE